MCASLSRGKREERPVEELPHADVEKAPAQLIKVEANLLRLPLFALDTKGLKSLDGIECSGRLHRDGETHQFTFQATRNTATLYPGPLSRSAHLAFMSILSEEGFPSQGPITWTWRDLCRRMRVTYGGQMVRHLKEAITSTAGLILQSELALYSKADGQLLSTQHDVLHLYDRVAFVGTPLPDGTIPDGNYLWFSEWYRKNLNAMFSAPLDYDLWRHLDERSPIASRLYEFLLLNFYSPTPVLRINYRTLVQFLPVHAEKYRSSAKRQLVTPLKLLTDARILRSVEWTDTKHPTGQLLFHRGERLRSSADRRNILLPFADEEFTDSVAVKELRNLKPPEWTLITDFYRLWASNDRHRPTPKELDQARTLIAEHGLARAKSLVPLLVKHLKVGFPDAKAFGATAFYLPDALRELQRDEHVRQKERREREEEELSRRRTVEQAKDRAAWKAIWDTLPDHERRDIRTAVLAEQPRGLQKFPEVIERFCLDELARRRTTEA